MLTYESLRELVNKEKKEQKLIELPERFFSDAKTYLDNKSKLSKGNEDLWELDNSKRMLQDLIDSRESKLVKLALVFVRAGVTPGKGGEIQLTDAILQMINYGDKVLAYDFDGKRYDTGDKLGYIKANIEYGLRHDEFKDDLKHYLRDLVNQIDGEE